MIASSAQNNQYTAQIKFRSYYSYYSKYLREKKITAKLTERSVCYRYPYYMTLQNNKPESTKRILEAAEILFSEKGFEGTSISAIAKVAEVSKANIYHHFESKEALYIQVLKSACEDFSNIVDGLISVKGLLEDRLGKFASSHIVDMEKRNRGTRLILRELIEGDRNRQQIFAENVASDHFHHLLSVIQNSQESGAVRKDVDPAVVAMLMLGANIFFFMAKDTLQHLDDFTLSDYPEDFGYAISNIITNGISKIKTRIS